MKTQSLAVAIYDTHTAAEEAIEVLRGAGTDMTQLSIVGKDYRTEDHVVGYYNTGGNLKYWGKLGVFWAGIWKILAGEAFFWMPGVGPILVGGPLVSSIVGTLEGSTVHNGLTALGSALHLMGIPKSNVISYEAALKANKFLVVVHGDGGDASKVSSFLRKTEPMEVAAHETAPSASSMPFALPSLPYPTNALEPHVSRETLEFHHGHHHAAYVKALNRLVSGTAFAGRSLNEIIEGSSPGPLHDAAAQHFNHSFYWNCLEAPCGDVPRGLLAAKLRDGFGSIEQFTRRFEAVANGQFGSGWAWLVRNADGSLSVEASANADTPVGTERTPLLTCDVWEHAYYVDYRDDRGGYVEAFWNVVNWDFVATNLAAAETAEVAIAS